MSPINNINSPKKGKAYDSKNKKRRNQKIANNLHETFIEKYHPGRNDSEEIMYSCLSKNYRYQLTNKRVYKLLGIYKAGPYDLFQCLLHKDQQGLFVIETGTGDDKKTPKIIDVRELQNSLPLLNQELLKDDAKNCFITTSPELAKKNNAYCKKHGFKNLWVCLYEFGGSVSHHSLECLSGRKNVIFFKDRSYNHDSTERSDELAVTVLKKLEAVGCIEPLCVAYQAHFDAKEEYHTHAVIVEDLTELKFWSETTKDF